MPTRREALLGVTVRNYTDSPQFVSVHRAPEQSKLLEFAIGPALNHDAPNEYQWSSILSGPILFKSRADVCVQMALGVGVELHWEEPA